MHDDNQSIETFERMCARARLAEEARHLDEEDEPRLLGSHVAAERETQRLMSVLAMAAVAVLLGLLLYAI